MSKYKEALNRLSHDDYDFPYDYYDEDRSVAIENDWDTLEELVDNGVILSPETKYIVDAMAHFITSGVIPRDTFEGYFGNTELGYMSTQEILQSFGMELDWSNDNE